MMRRIIRLTAILLVLTMALGVFIACGGEDDTPLDDYVNIMDAGNGKYAVDIDTKGVNGLRDYLYNVMEIRKVDSKATITFVSKDRTGDFKFSFGTGNATEATKEYVSQRIKYVVELPMAMLTTGVIPATALFNDGKKVYITYVFDIGKARKIQYIEDIIDGGDQRGYLEGSAVARYVPMEVCMIDSTDADANMEKYYIGNVNDVDLTTAFPHCSEFSGDMVTNVDGKYIIKAGSGAGKMSYKDITGVQHNVNIYDVEAVNIYGAKSETDMRATLNKGSSVVLHTDVTTEGKDGFAIKSGATVYGNGHKLYADSISAPRGADKKTWGANTFYIGDGTSLNIQDLQIIVNTIGGESRSDTYNLDNFCYSGTAIYLNAKTNESGKYDMSTITNCIVENGQKLIQVEGADVTIDGCIVRNGADANIAIATLFKSPSHVTIRNSVSVNSMVAGLLFYGSTEMDESDTAHQNTLNVEGFFDIYNWRDVKEIKPVPRTESPMDNMVNSKLQDIVDHAMYDPFFYHQNGNKYAHLGIIILATGGLKGQQPIFQQDGKNGLPYGYHEVGFPIPPWATALNIMRRCSVIAYNGEVDATISIQPNSKLPISGAFEDTIYHDLLFGRKSK